MSYRPRALFAFFMPYPFTGNEIGSGEVPLYVGVLPFVLFLVGVWQHWKTAWVRYWTGLAGLAFLYSLGAYSFLHAFSYAFVPYLWMAREASRFIYLSHFAIAILAGYGVKTLFSESNHLPESFQHFLRNLKCIIVLVAVLLGIPALYGKPDVGEWTYFSFLFLLVSYGFLRYTMRRQDQRLAQFLLVAIILSDWSPTTWMIVNKIQSQEVRQDEYSRLRNCRSLTDYLMSKPGLYRVKMEMPFPPSIGDCYGVQTTNGYTASMLADYGEFWKDVPQASDLLNVRYIVKDQPLPGRESIYKEGNWHVYENPSAFPRAWLVHQVVVEPFADKAKQELGDPNFDRFHKAIIRNSLGVELESVTTGLGEEIQWDHYQGDRFELRVKAKGRGLLVLSETFYPGWKATVNGQPAPIHKVDGLLRGVIVPRGDSRVVLRYAPLSVLIGAILTLTGFLGTLGFAMYASLRAKR
jgi:hypothetical protein